MTDEQQNSKEIELHIKSDDPESFIVTRRELRLEMKSFRSEMRLLVISSVALNQFLTHVVLPTEATAAALSVFGAKLVWGFFTNR